MATIIKTGASTTASAYQAKQKTGPTGVRQLPRGYVWSGTQWLPIHVNVYKATVSSRPSDGQLISSVPSSLAIPYPKLEVTVTGNIQGSTNSTSDSANGVTGLTINSAMNAFEAILLTIDSGKVIGGTGGAGGDGKSPNVDGDARRGDRGGNGGSGLLVQTSAGKVTLVNNGIISCGYGGAGGGGSAYASWYNNNTGNGDANSSSGGNGARGRNGTEYNSGYINGQSTTTSIDYADLDGGRSEVKGGNGGRGGARNASALAGGQGSTALYNLPPHIIRIRSTVGDGGSEGNPGNGITGINRLNLQKLGTVYGTTTNT